MSTNRSVDRFAVTHKKDRSGLCSFTFADGRQCRTPRRAGHPRLCFFHAQKEAQSRAAKQAGEGISSFLSGDYLSACDLSSALARVFSAVARGEIKPKTASTLAYLGQTLINSIPIAQHEYINAFGTNSWRKTVASSFIDPATPKEPTAPPAPAPQRIPVPQSALAPQSPPAPPASPSSK